MTDVTAARYHISGKALSPTKIILVSGTTVTGATDTLTVKLSDYGCSQLLAIQGSVHTTDYSVVVDESGTCSVSAGVVTYLTATSNNNKRRVVEILAI